LRTDTAVFATPCWDAPAVALTPCATPADCWCCSLPAGAALAGDSSLPDDGLWAVDSCAVAADAEAVAVAEARFPWETSAPGSDSPEPPEDEVLETSFCAAAALACECWTVAVGLEALWSAAAFGELGVVSPVCGELEVASLTFGCSPLSARDACSRSCSCSGSDPCVGGPSLGPGLSFAAEPVSEPVVDAAGGFPFPSDAVPGELPPPGGWAAGPSSAHAGATETPSRTTIAVHTTANACRILLAGAPVPPLVRLSPDSSAAPFY
jgi:hypothetical protein